MWPFIKEIVERGKYNTPINKERSIIADPPLPKPSPVWVIVCNATRSLNSPEEITEWIEVLLIDRSVFDDALISGLVWQNGNGGYVPRLISDISFTTKESAVEFMINHERDIKEVLPKSKMAYDSECIKLRRVLK
jgi:hypothetical protein